MSPKYAEVAAAWNARWEYPKIIVGRMDEFFHYVEDHAGKQLPVVHGDLGVVWEDGAASTALETAMVRRAKARLDAAERWHALAATAFPAAEIHAAWEQVLLFDEHTWGAAGSVSDPESEQTRHQWAVKASFAHEAARRADDLLKSGLHAQRRGEASSQSVAVFNEQSWARDIVASIPSPGTVVDAPSQVEGDRDVFLARQVPPLGWKSYRIEATPTSEKAAPLLRKGLDDWSWETPDFRLKISPATGALSSLYDKTLHTEWVQPIGGYGLNQFLYVLGGDGPRTVSTHTAATVTILQNGPVRAVLQITRTGPTAPATDTYLLLGPGRRVEFLNVVHKAPTLAKEAGYFAFPFRLANPGAVRAFVELPYGAMEVDRDQAPGGYRDWYATNSFAAVSDGQRTATLATPHTPMITFNGVLRDRLKQRAGPFNGAIFAYVFNNYWGTNYKASQGGDMVFSFALDLRAGSFDPAAATRFGWDALSTMSDPALGASTDLWAAPPAEAASTATAMSQLQLSGDAVVVGGVTRHDKLLQVRLYNPSGHASEATLTLPGQRLAEAWIADLTGAPKARLPIILSGAALRVVVPARGLATVLLQPIAPT
jgi:hypothetical protein